MQQQVMKELRSQRESQAVGFDASWNWMELDNQSSHRDSFMDLKRTQK